MSRTIKQESGLLLLFGLYLFIAVNGFWRNNALTGSLIIAASLAMLACWRSPKNALAYLSAAFLGFICEYLLTTGGYWHYNNPSTVIITRNLTIATLPWWLFFLWGYFIVLFIQAAYLLEKLIQGLKASGVTALAEKVFFPLLWLAAMAYVFFIYVNLSFDLTRWFLLIIVPAALFWRRRIDLLAFFTGALFGTLGEYTSIRFGVFQYHAPYFNAIGIPLSLPLAWGLSTLLIRRFTLLFR